MPKIFISHTHSDKEIADSINAAVVNLFGERVIDVEYSTKKESSGGIRPGEDWFDWIVDQVIESDVALVLLTPSSIQKPWILWEAGAVEGVSMAAERSRSDNSERRRKVIPLSYKLKPAEIPSPFHRIQVTRGDQDEDVNQFLRDLINQFAGSLDSDSLIRAGERLTKTAKAYMKRISEAMQRAPLLVSEAAVQEWLERLRRYEKRPSEIAQLHNWIKVAFGRGEEEGDRPLDLRIHRQLAELYSRSDTVDSRRRAACELELARQLTPRDIFVLRQQGNAYIAMEEYDKAWEVIEEIEELDKEAFERNAECAALKGKWLRRKSDPAEAAKVYAGALRHNRDSYYLANLAAEASLEAGDKQEAEKYYTDSRDIIERLNESNIWAWASAVNACLALSEEEEAKRLAAKIAGAEPSNEELNSIEGGFRVVQSHYDLPEPLLAELSDILRQRESS